MKYLKPLSFALVTLGLSSPSMGNDLFHVPCQKGGPKVEIGTSYVQSNSLNQNVDNNYDFASHLKMGYLIPQTGNDLTLNYTYYRPADNGSQIVQNEITTVLLNGKQSAELDIADLEAGQRICTSAFDIRLFGGARYTRLGNQLSLESADTTFNSSDFNAFNTTFHGMGPKFGVDSRYNFCNGFGLNTHVNTALLVGNMHSKCLSTKSVTYSEDSRIVPEIEAKVGLDYSFCTSKSTKSLVTFEVGYHINNYFNIIDNNSFTNQDNVNFKGAYLDIKYCS